jgi:hypothetical protein
VTPLIEWAAAVERSLNPLIVHFSILSGLVLAGVALSFFALARAKAAGRAADERLEILRQEWGAALDPVRDSLNGLAGQMAEIRRHAAAVPSLPKPGFNLTKRSQALRLHRRGETPERIAAELDIPPQEVDLLLKVHRIVIRDL